MSIKASLQNGKSHVVFTSTFERPLHEYYLVLLIQSNNDVRASVSRHRSALTVAEPDHYDDGNIQGPYTNPVAAFHFWLDGLIEPEVIQLREADDLDARMGNTNFGGGLALLNQKASKRGPPVELEWEEPDERVSIRRLLL